LTAKRFACIPDWPRSARRDNGHKDSGLLITEGLPNKQIASELVINIKTVEKHRQQVMDKLNIHQVAGLTPYAISKGMVEGTAPAQPAAVAESSTFSMMFAHSQFRGSAVVSTAVFGVPPNTLLRRLFLNQSVLDRLFIEIIKAGCGTRDASRRDQDGRALRIH
jgi:hypothetical protein